MTSQLFIAVNNSSTLHLVLLLPPCPCLSSFLLILKFPCWVVSVVMIPKHTQTQICLSPTFPDCHTRESRAEGGTIRVHCSAQPLLRPGFAALVSAPVLLSHSANAQNCLEYINIANSVFILINNDI